MALGRCSGNLQCMHKGPCTRHLRRRDFLSEVRAATGRGKEMRGSTRSQGERTDIQELGEARIQCLLGLLVGAVPWTVPGVKTVSGFLA